MNRCVHLLLITLIYEQRDTEAQMLVSPLVQHDCDGLIFLVAMGQAKYELVQCQMP